MRRAGPSPLWRRALSGAVSDGGAGARAEAAAEAALGAGGPVGGADGGGGGAGWVEPAVGAGPARAAGPEAARRLRGLARVWPAFLSGAEQAALRRELEPLLARRRYQRDHWDGAIRGFRETERCRWGPAARAALERAAAAAFPPPAPPPQPLVHVLDLHPGGHVAPHVDSVKFCGCTIAGLSLLSAAVLRLRSCRGPPGGVELLLEPGSLYVLRGAARYEFTHEILPQGESFFGGRRVPRGRRVSLILRNAPGGGSPPGPPPGPPPAAPPKTAGNAQP
ncbi:alpha-ketoglutarate-dependent dioxygenase alkB homolog 7, mitochondrial [Eudromia elegans]